MFLDKGGDEEIAVIVSLLQAQGAGDPALHRSGGECFRLEMRHELVVGADVDEQWDIKAVRSHLKRRIMSLPCALVGAEIG